MQLSSTKLEYVPVSPNDSEKGQADIFLDKLKPKYGLLWWSSRNTLLLAIPWLLAILFASVSLILLIERYSASSTFGTYETYFKADLALSNIPLELRRFTGSPHFFNNGSPWKDPVDETAPWPENVTYFGEPSPELDANWQRLIGERYFPVMEDEAVRAWGDRRLEYVDQNLGGYTAGLDMFHTLHCVNSLRKALRPDYYPPKSKTLHGALHNEHCLNIIRQMVQCYGSTTLIPTKYMDGLEHNYIDSDQVHVCRSFNFLRDYTTSRSDDREAAAFRDQSLLDEKMHQLSKAWGAAYRQKLEDVVNGVV